MNFKPRRVVGMIAVSLLLVMAGMLMCEVMFGGCHYSRNKLAQVQARVLAERIELFRQDNGHLPDVLDLLTSNDAPGPYVRTDALIDPWGELFFYRIARDGSFMVFSLGADQRLGGRDENRDVEAPAP